MLRMSDEEVTLQTRDVVRVSSERDDTHYSIDVIRDKVLLDNLDPRMFPAKLKLRWLNPFVVQKIFPYGTIEVTHLDYDTFKVNDYRLKLYFGGDTNNEIEELRLRNPNSPFA
ncbi:Retrovirus-related Pol polyprotein from transposon 297 family [Gossypium australe]|uniref:Retrovirus-related Pol polyprotein from transposon 297 family n=1 Tax=Gossypium australe TaxID=47621 RepID=A0A5B6V1B1_9ROSI|nr:Retrovirus-related Pol polyprotein from transposon 297 family [Gossypium australe]